MNKKPYFLAVAAIVIIAAAIGVFGVYRQGKRVTVSPKSTESQELPYETESLSQDVAELEETEEDTALDTLDQDLSDLSGEVSETASGTPAADVPFIENLKSELDTELGGFSNDLTDLERLEGDASLSDLDSSLSNL